ncbi:protein of unknown function [Shinella sp. WSC3-e]|nr:hypothetical protein SHINE37_44556 [Rhizobiaceae bacterium]CAK7259040.1 protein of unknown function [Shinella sp. WSC3-e]
MWMPVKALPGGILPRRARSVRAGRKPASVLPAPVGAMSSRLSPAVARARSSIWCARGCHPLAENQAVKAAGRRLGPVVESTVLTGLS